MEFRVLKIAVCDDLEECRENVVQMLQRIDSRHNVKEFTSGKELLSSKTKFDIIYLDIEMPELDGMEVAERIRLTDEDVILIFLTHYCKRPYTTECYRFGVHRFLEKPKDAEDEENLSKFSEALVSAERKISEIKVIKINGVRIDTTDDTARKNNEWWRERELREFGERETIVIKQKDIIFVTSNYQTLTDRATGVYFHTKNDGIFYSNIAIQDRKKGKTLKNDCVSLILGDIEFCIPHKAYLFVLEHLKSIVIGSPVGKVTMHHTSVTVELSRKCALVLKKAWVEYLIKYSGTRWGDKFD